MNRKHRNRIRKIARFLIPGSLLLMAIPIMSQNDKNVVDEVAWIVGDEAIFRSDVEEQYQQLRTEGTAISGDPYCFIPEQMAVEKLYLHQAKIDTIEVPESSVRNMVDQRLNFFINQLGSKEKVEEYFHKPMPVLRESLIEMMKNSSIVGQVQRSLTEDVTATPNEVKKYFNSLPSDSIPYVPMQVEVQIVTLNPNIPRQEIEDVKARLREYADRVNKGEADFSTLAIMYSEDGSSMQGGELGYNGRAAWVPEFANVAFNLTDPKKVSRIVETEYGYHIIQLIDKRGDQVNVRHILLTPKVSQKDLTDATNRLDSVRKEIVSGAFTFEEAASYISQDKDTRNNKGVMTNNSEYSDLFRSSKFEMQDLPAEVARQIEKMNPGDISEAFIMKNSSHKDVAAIVKLKERIPGHRANLSDDYNLLKKMYENHKKETILKEWLEKKIKETYVKIEPSWQNCEFKYQGWIKQ
ncbi:MAG: peptidylprolyl isomerase [Muribaculaceae bacterium]|nr:peptidylprolyl isomerase [Muribaculaceae bacterium]